MATRQGGYRVRASGDVLTVYTPSPYSGQAADLAGYVERELQRVAESIAGIQGGGTLFLGEPFSPAPLKQLTTTYELFQDFTDRSPARYRVGVEPDIALSGLYVRSSGLWGVGFSIVAGSLQADSAYSVRVFVDGYDIGLVAHVSTENKIVEASFAASGILRIDLTKTPGKLELWHRESSGGAGDWQTLAAYFSCWKVSD